MEFLRLSFVILVGEELTVFGFVREECEKTLRTTGLADQTKRCCVRDHGTVNRCNCCKAPIEKR